MSTTASVKAREILDSRGDPTDQLLRIEEELGDQARQAGPRPFGRDGGKG